MTGREYLFDLCRRSSRPTALIALIATCLAGGAIWGWRHAAAEREPTSVESSATAPMMSEYSAPAAGLVSLAGQVFPASDGVSGVVLGEYEEYFDALTRSFTVQPAKARAGQSSSRNQTFRYSAILREKSPGSGAFDTIFSGAPLKFPRDVVEGKVTTTATNSKLSGIAVAEVETGSFHVLIDGNDFNASFSARGDRLVFTSMRDGNAELYLLNLNAGGVERLTNNMGLDDGAVFVGELARPARQAR